MLQTDEIRNAWNLMAETFETWVEPHSVLMARSLMTLLQLDRATGLLEVGAGAGAAARVATGLLPAGARQVATDLSPEMVRRAKAKNPEIEVLEADAEHLPFADGSFDRYLANLNLQLVADPDAALKEAFRVLAPGGLAAWSVWGRRSRSPLMVLPERALAKAGIEVVEQRSNFHLRHRKALLRRMRRAGFRELIWWRQPMLQPFADGPDFARRIQESGPRLRRMLEGVSPEQRQTFERELAKMAQKVLDRGHPLALEVLMVVGRRPEVAPMEDEPEVTEESPELDDLEPLSVSSQEVTIALRPDSTAVVIPDDPTAFPEPPAGVGDGTVDEYANEDLTIDLPEADRRDDEP